MPQEKKIPQRRCVGCGEHKAKRELIRVVREDEQTFSIDVTGKKNGNYFGTRRRKRPADYSERVIIRSYRHGYFRN